MLKNYITKLFLVVFVAAFLLGSCKTAQKLNNTVDDGQPKSSITGPKQLKITTYPLPQKPELKVFWIDGNEVLAQSIEPFKTETVLYSSSNLKDFTVKSKIPDSKGYYYSSPDGRKLLFYISFGKRQILPTLFPHPARRIIFLKEQNEEDFL